MCRCRSRNCGTVEKLKKYVGKSPSFKGVGSKKNTRKNTTENRTSDSYSDIFFQRSLLCKVGGGGKHNWMWFVGEDKISSCKEARPVSEEARCFLLFLQNYSYQLHLCEWMASSIVFSVFFFLNIPGVGVFFCFCFVVSVKMWPETEELFLFWLPNIMEGGESFQSCDFPIPPEIRLGSFRSSIDRWCIPTSWRSAIVRAGTFGSPKRIRAMEGTKIRWKFLPEKNLRRGF